MSALRCQLGDTMATPGNNGVVGGTYWESPATPHTDSFVNGNSCRKEQGNHGTKGLDSHD